MGRQGSRAEVKTSGEESQSTKKEGSTTKTKQIEQIGVCVCSYTQWHEPDVLVHRTHCWRAQPHLTTWSSWGLEAPTGLGHGGNPSCW